MVVVRIDLHTHSTVSDGTDGPADLVAVAAAAGLGVVALTDHDTTAGWQSAADALPRGMRLVPGAELSCESDDGRGGRVSVHLLAYLFDPAAPAIVAEQRRLREQRRSRLRTIAGRMAADGLPVDADEILARLGPDAPAGRPHLAQALVRAGLCETVDEAFGSYLAGGRGYSVARRDTPVERAIDMIAEAGGVTVLAHPFAFQRGPTVSAEVIESLARRGLTGVEVDHPNHDGRTRDELRALAKDLGLVRTGSSDYHGTNKSIAIGQEVTAPEEFDALIAQATGTDVVVGGPRRR
ncbi:PHP domain-containing protein [Prauserella isguenensis]|uniref:PHP domain-containing protein n=1 Tax=Prauserella isguenensis TaxID=1470180 RepID=UPI00161F1255|nr:PHP domain-containing protein [Prauserella isguenensis]